MIRVRTDDGVIFEGVDAVGVLEAMRGDAAACTPTPSLRAYLEFVGRAYHAETNSDLDPSPRRALQQLVEAGFLTPL
jgi:hypothetical protein